MAERMTKPVTAEWLREMYITHSMTCVDIGKLVSRDPKTVHNWMREFGIPTRPRGSHTSVHFKKGERGGFAGQKHSDASKQKIRAARLSDGHFPKDNGRPYWQGKTGPDHPAWAGGSTPERQAFYSTSE